MANAARIDTFWPNWLAADLEQVNIWSLEYAAHSLMRQHTSLPLTSTAKKALNTLYGMALGERPIVFICHSLGGLLVKQMLRTAHEFRNPHWKPITHRVHGVAFFGTPHEGSDQATYATYLSKIAATLLGGAVGVSPIVAEQDANAHNLLDLAQWYRDNVAVEQVGA